MSPGLPKTDYSATAANQPQMLPAQVYDQMPVPDYTYQQPYQQPPLPPPVQMQMQMLPPEPQHLYPGAGDNGPYYHVAPVVDGVANPVSSEPIVDETSKKFEALFRGPLSAKRSCTDIICLVLFLVVLVGFIVVSLAGFLVGNPLIFMLPQNSEKQMCGYGSLHLKSFLLPFDPVNCIATQPSTYMTSGCQTSMCVHGCPTENWHWGDHKGQLGFVVNRNNTIYCRDGANLTNTIDFLVQNHWCAPYYFASKDYLFRCEPKFLSEPDRTDDLALAQGYTDAGGQSLKIDAATSNLAEAHDSLVFFSAMIDDLSKSWPHILVFTGITMAISIIWIICLRFVGPCLIWFSVIVLVVGSGAAAAFCIIIYDGLAQGYDTILFIPAKDLAVISKEVWLIIGVLACILFLILMIVFCAVFNRVRLAAAIIGEASHAVAGSFGAVFWPIIPFILQCAIHALFVSGMIYYLTANSTGQATLDFATIQVNAQHMWPVILGLLFAWFWIINFILALNYVTLSGSFSSWYWNHPTKADKASGRPDASESCQLMNSLGRALRYHTGSMAFGALIIAIIQFIRAIIFYVQKQFMKMQNPIGRFFLCCLQCCLKCIEEILKAITKNAYIMVALKGKNFCYSARKALRLLIENIVRFAVLDGMSTAIVALSIFIIVSGVGVCALFLFNPSLVIEAYGWTWLEPVVPEVRYFYVPLTVTVIASLIAALSFFSVYKMAIDTIFLNLMYDIKYNDGSEEKPYRASKSLLKICSKKNKKVVAPDDDEEKKAQ